MCLCVCLLLNLCLICVYMLRDFVTRCAVGLLYVVDSCAEADHIGNHDGKLTCEPKPIPEPAALDGGEETGGEGEGAESDGKEL